MTHRQIHNSITADYNYMNVQTFNANKATAWDWGASARKLRPGGSEAGCFRDEAPGAQIAGCCKKGQKAGERIGVRDSAQKAANRLDCQSRL